MGRKHRDKYAALAKKPRQCVRSDGIQKRIMDEQDAIIAAQELANREGKVMSAYRCNKGCGGWHAGHAILDVATSESYRIHPEVKA